ncbi:sugar phosphate isomerase/epimerase family protein [Thalassobaculum sp.]|uniref:sugar phosphate isomerase/epimerase family protein n=1 Tax=Thalassobaculum sp. TaxID=2022740 RepID=UPI003B5AB919
MASSLESGWAVGINTYAYIWRMSARETLVHLADRGYRRFELLVNAPHLWPESLDRAERRAVAALLEERGLTIDVLNPPSLDLNLVSPSLQMREMTRAHYRRVIELASDWQVANVLIVPGKTHPLLPAPAERVWGWFSEAVEELDRYAEDKGVRIILENVPMAFLPRAADLMAALDRLGIDRLGLCYDVANAVFAGEAPERGLRMVAPRLSVLHLSDTGREKWDHAAIGTGVVPFAAVAEAMREAAIRVPTMLEIISPDGDRDIAQSHQVLAGLGWEAPPSV